MRRLLFSVLSLAVAASGCAALQRETRARELAGDYVYAKPLSEVWPHVAALLVEHGYTPRETEKPYVLETDWKAEVAGSRTSGTFSRYVVVGKDSGGQSIVRILRNTRRSEHAELNTTDTRQDRAVTNDEQGGRSSEQARYGTNTDTGRALEHDEEDAGAGIAGSRSTTGAPKPSGSRDLQMEWLLIQRADPDGAAKIYAQVEAK